VKLVVVAAAVLALVVVVAVAFGTEPVSIARALGSGASLDRTIVFDVRAPRVLLAAIAGGGLAAVGAAF